MILSFNKMQYFSEINKMDWDIWFFAFGNYERGLLIKRNKVNYFFSDKSGNRKRINVAITGSSNPITNQSLGFLPNRFAILEVIIGILNKKSIPMLINNTAPISLIKEQR